MTVHSYALLLLACATVGTAAEAAAAAGGWRGQAHQVSLLAQLDPPLEGAERGHMAMRVNLLECVYPLICIISKYSLQEAWPHVCFSDCGLV